MNSKLLGVVIVAAAGAGAAGVGAFLALRFWQMDYLAGKEKEMEQFLRDKGMQFTNPDRDAFRKAAAAAYESDFVKKMEPRSAEIIKKIREIVANTK